LYEKKATTLQQREAGQPYEAAHQPRANAALPGIGSLLRARPNAIRTNVEYSCAGAHRVRSMTFLTPEY